MRLTLKYPFSRVAGLLLLLAVALSGTPSGAAVPELMNYQGILKDGLGNPVVDGAYIVTFSIYDAPSGGTQLWTEAQGVNTASGLFAVLLGTSVPLPDSVFVGSARYLGVSVNGDPEMTPRQRLVTVAYSYRVNSVDSALGGNITTKVSIGPGHTNTGSDAFVAGINNQVTGSASTVGGGSSNIASGTISTVSGGFDNVATGHGSTIGGGDDNNSTGDRSTVGGGVRNTASGAYSTSGGGMDNEATGAYATVGGGESNKARGNFSVIGGGGGAPFDSNAAIGEWTVVSGGFRNWAVNRVSTIGGGFASTTTGDYATIAGGFNHQASGPYATIGGGDRNGASGYDATVSGGGLNFATADGATVGGGSYNLSSGGSAFVGGGSGNAATAIYATVSGGSVDTASADYATVGGGQLNRATGFFATIAGGDRNTAGGVDATVGGGAFNVASANVSTVSGGISNSASGNGSMIPGGMFNIAAGNFSFAAGYGAKADHLGSYVWADTSVNAYFPTTANNQYLIRAAGGVGINTNTPPAGALQVLGGVVVGNGTAMQTVLSSSVSLDFPNTAAAAASDLTIAVTGASSGDVVSLGVPGGSVPAGGSYFGWVSASNTVTVRFSNSTAGALNPAVGTFRAMVTKF